MGCGRGNPPAGPIPVGQRPAPESFEVNHPTSASRLIERPASRSSSRGHPSVLQLAGPGHHPNPRHPASGVRPITAGGPGRASRPVEAAVIGHPMERNRPGPGGAPQESSRAARQADVPAGAKPANPVRLVGSRGLRRPPCPGPAQQRVAAGGRPRLRLTSRGRAPMLNRRMARPLGSVRRPPLNTVR